MQKFLSNSFVHGVIALVIVGLTQFALHSSYATVTVGAIATWIASWLGGLPSVTAARGR